MTDIFTKIIRFYLHSALIYYYYFSFFIMFCTYLIPNRNYEWNVKRNNWIGIGLKYCSFVSIMFMMLKLNDSCFGDVLFCLHWIVVSNKCRIVVAVNAMMNPMDLESMDRMPMSVHVWCEIFFFSFFVATTIIIVVQLDEHVCAVH